MPINPIMLQRRLAEVGRIRIGKTVPPTGNGKRPRPVKLTSFRFTSADKIRIEQIAAAYGGTVDAWTPLNGGAAQWEVITETDSIPIVVPPQPVTQWMELWSGGGCVRRCDGDREIRGDTPCVCAANDDMACKPTTRLSVLLKDIEGLGSWRLESHGWNAAAELPGMAELLAQTGGYVAARLYLKQVRQVTDGQTKDFLVPAIAVDGVTPAQLLTGQGATLGLTAGSAQPVAQIGPGPAIPPHLAGYYHELEQAATQADCMDIYSRAKAAGHLEDPPGLALYKAIGDHGRALADTAPVGPADAVDDAPADEPEEDADAIWDTIIRTAGQHGLTLSDVEAEFAKANGGCSPAVASAGELRVFLDGLKARAA